MINLAVSQSNPVLGDLDSNVRLVLDAAQQAHDSGAQLLITPELSLTGYPPEDLLFREAFILEAAKKLEFLAAELAKYPTLNVLVGHPRRIPEGLQNCASNLFNGKVTATYVKQCLPNNEVFDEARYFVPGESPCVFNVGEIRVGMIICEDAWHSDPARLAKNAGAQLLIIVNASPYHQQKQLLREEILKKRVLEIGIPLIYVNSVGGQDELVFDGGSCAFNSAGNLILRLPQFRETFEVFRFNDDFVVNTISPLLSNEAEVYEALVLGTRDYIHKNGFSGAIIGLSGGVDSALVLAIAVDAIGVDKVRAVMMPSRYTADISWLDAREMTSNLGVQYDEIPISPMFEAFENSLRKEFARLPIDATEENIQARIRGTLLMALSNKSGRIVLTTGNKSEMAVGYCTLYGDMAGGFAVIKDIPKTLVYRLCKYRNQIFPVIPERIIRRPPSAELRADQKDQDTLPEYDVLDNILSLYIENNLSIESIIDSGHKYEDVERVTKLIKLNEYKRRQSPIGIRITKKAFGRDWRYPVTNKFRK